MEIIIRAHVPCFSCATHELDGRIVVKIDILNAAGEKVAILLN